MSKPVSYCILIVSAAIVVVLSAVVPNLLSDQNAFLKGFISDGLLDVLGVILAITLASAGQLHLTLNQIEERHKRHIFGRMRGGIKMAASWLIILFVVAVIIVVAKPLCARTAAIESLFNGFGLFVLLWNVLLLVSLTQGIFAIKSEIPD